MPANREDGALTMLARTLALLLIACSAMAVGVTPAPVTVGTTLGTGAAGNYARIVGAVQPDDPTGTIYGLGASAVLRGQVNILKLAGVKYGIGQNTAVRQANATALQAAFTTANTYRLELACPAAATIEIDNSGGIVVPAVGVGFRARLNQNCAIVQYGTNTPILTIADPAGASYKYDVDWDGGSFDYGVAQTGDTNSIAVLLGAMAYCRITGINANAQASDPAAYVAFQIGNSDYAGSAPSAFFSNTLGRINAEKSQYANMARFIGGTGNVFTDIYLSNGGNAATASPLSQAGFYDHPQGVASDNVFIRLNVEHNQVGAGVIWTNNVYNETFINLHLEDDAIDNYGSQFVYAVNSDLHFVDPGFLDLKTLSHSSGPIAIFRSVYGSHLAVDGTMKLKWSVSPANQITNSGVYFFKGATGAANADDLLNFRTSSVSVEDDSGTNATKVQLDPIITTPLSILQYWGGYQYDPLLPTTDHAIFTIPAATTAFTLYGEHGNATVVLGTGEAAARTITLSNTRKASGTASSVAASVGQIATVHWNGGTHAYGATIQNGAGKTITTIATSVTASSPYVYIENGTNFVAAP